MPRLIDVMKRLFPDGTRPGEEPSVEECPDWPPDVFALAATVADLSGLYAQPWFTAGWDKDACLFLHSDAEEAMKLGRLWATSGVPPEQVVQLWLDLHEAQDTEIGRPTTGPEAWQHTILKLLAIADEACLGIGFAVSADDKSIFARFALLEFQKYEKNEPRELPYLPSSLCRMVPDTECCVQPKTNTPVVGCSLRSLSHHLALLPPLGVVNNCWFFGHADGEAARKPLNVLLVPFPYVVRGLDFSVIEHSVDPVNRFFTVIPGWLKKDGKDIKPDKIAAFLLGLVHEAKREVDEVHGIVLPECALPWEIASDVALELARTSPGLEFFIAGTTALDGGRGHPDNTAYTARLHDGQVLRGWGQTKHHRWRLDRGQIARYHLGHVLDPDCCWWEQIDIRERVCVFSVVRPEVSLAVLVCEDLARFDPVLPAINAIGPTLVIALLMDGPQLERRWPGRYATVLADDPGSSVLTLTCLGMIRRSSMPGDDTARQIALWKEQGDVARELLLPKGDHALLLSLTASAETQTTLDLRKHPNGTQRLRLTAARGVRLPQSEWDGWPEFE